MWYRVAWNEGIGTSDSVKREPSMGGKSSSGMIRRVECLLVLDTLPRPIYLQCLLVSFTYSSE
jgi:hypothetical protein